MGAGGAVSAYAIGKSLKGKKNGHKNPYVNSPHELKNQADKYFRLKKKRRKQRDMMYRTY